MCMVSMWMNCIVMWCMMSGMLSWCFVFLVFGMMLCNCCMMWCWLK